MLKACLLAASALLPSTASACTIAVKGAGYAMIDIVSKPEPGICDLSKFPAPWNTLLGIQQGSSRAFFWAYEDKQRVYIMFQIDGDGNGRVIFHYTNDKQADGDTFVAGIRLKDADGKDIGYIGSQRGVNARSAGDDVKDLKGSPEYWASVRYLQFSFGYYDSVDDKALWDGAKAAASAAGCAFGGICIGG